MPSYICKLLYTDGRTAIKLLKESEYQQLLVKGEPIIVDSFKIPNILAAIPNVIDLFLYKLRIKGVKTSEIVDFSKSMSVMLRAGIPVTVAVEDYADVTTNKIFKKTLIEVVESVLAGESLSRALSKHEGVFPEVMVRMVRIGEETGSLDKIFSDIATHFERIETLKSNIKRALMYPSFVMCSAFGALLFWLVYVLPKLSSLFGTMGVKLPALTIFVMNLSSFLNKTFLYFLGFVIVFIIIVAILRRKSETIAYLVDRVFLSIPIVKLLLHNFYLAFIAEYMRLLVISGSSIDKSLELISESIGNRVYKKAIKRIRERVLLGEALSSAFSKESLFPKFLIRMLRSGEESGLLDEQLSFAAEVYYDKLNDVSQKLGKMLEPIILIVVGGMFALIMLALLLPVYDLVSKLGR